MKKWWTSKTLWINILAVAGIAIQGITGKDILPPEAQISALAIVNMILRAVTKEPVTWK